MTELLVIGLNHKTASIDVRERLAFPEGGIERALEPSQILSFIKREYDPFHL